MLDNFAKKIYNHIFDNKSYHFGEGKSKMIPHKIELNGSVYELSHSIISITPAFSPGPQITHGALVCMVLSHFLVDL